jgi:hypothetical protein
VFQTETRVVADVFMSDRTYLLNFAIHKKERPVYMTIGDLSSKIRQLPSTHSMIIIALLLIPLTNCTIPQKWLDEQWQTNQEVLNEVLQQVLQLVRYKPNPCAKIGYYNASSADCTYSHCNPVEAAWLADCPEYSNVHHLEQKVWIWCECPKNELGDYVPLAK